MKKLLLIFALIPCVLKSQSYQQQQTQLYVYNALFGGVIAGVSELVANPRHVSHNKAFVHGFTMGLIGGSISYCGKSVGSKFITDGNYQMVWAARLISSLGNSVIYNAGHSTDKYFQYFNMDVGIIQLSGDIVNKRIMTKALPGAIAGISIALSNGGKFDAGKSLALLMPCFTIHKDNFDVAGYTYFSSITVNKRYFYSNLTIDSIRSHEYIHALQYMEYTNINNILFGWNNSFKNNNKMWKWIYLDIPYSDIAYGLNDKFLINPKSHYANFYEFEAESFSNRKFVDRTH